MKKITLLSAFLLFIWTISCTPKPSGNTERTVKIDTLGLIQALKEFQFYDSTSINLKFLAANIPLSEVKEYFSRRDTIFSEVELKTKIKEDNKRTNYKTKIGQIKVGDLKMLCGGDNKGQVIFIFGKKDKNLRVEIFGTKEITGSSFIIDVPSKGKIIDTNSHNNYISFGKDLEINDVRGFKEFSIYPYSIFSKRATKAWLDANSLKLDVKTEPKIKDSTILYIYYGFSGEKDLHPSVLLTSKDNLENEVSELTDGNALSFAFGNKGGLCCPPAE